MKEMKCVLCVAQAEGEKVMGNKEAKETKLGNAYVVYQGSTMCKRHMFEMVQTQIKQQQSMIAVPQVKGKIKLT